MDTFEIRDDEIDVEDLMRRVRENISRRKEVSVNSTDRSDNTITSVPEDTNSGIFFQQDLKSIHANWDVQNKNYHIHSHRPIVGKFLVKGREIVNGEIKRYVDPVVSKQAAFNRSIVRLLDCLSSLNTKIDQLRPEIDTKIDQLRPEIDTKIDQLRPEIDTKIDKLRPEIDTRLSNLRAEVNKKIDFLRLEFLENINSEIDTAISSMDSGTSRKECLSLIEGKIEKDIERQKTEILKYDDVKLNYFEFENRFRGSREDIKERQLKFIDYFSCCSNVLDIGSGRGEFLELAKEQGINAKGIDIDDDMVSYCIAKELNVEKIDAIQYLEKLDDNSLDGIFIDQVVEHLDPRYLIKLLNLCYQKLASGHSILIETVNPLSFFSFANFYIDLTHVKPVHPETLKYVLESMGFIEPDTIFISPVSEENRLKKISLLEGASDIERYMIETYNYNVDLLNSRLHGAQDYVVIGKK